MYLLKETFLKERETNTFAWNDKYYVDSSHSAYCDDGKCPEWNTSLLFKRMNGTSNGTQTGSGSTLNKEWTDIFVDSSEYDYLKSGDSNSGGAASEWYNLIVDHEWMYGDTINTTSSVIYNGKNMYDIETGQTSTTHYIGTAGNITEETNYKWNEKTDPVRAKIGLMYMHDVAYAYYDGNDPNTRGNPGNGTSVLNSWIHFRKDGYNTSSYYEWLSTRRGVFNTEVPYVWARYVYYDGTLNGSHELYYSFGVRPVFYLNSSAKIASGKGTKESPLILEI